MSRYLERFAANNDLPHILPPRTRPTRRPLHRFFLILLGVLLFTEVLGNGPVLLMNALAAPLQAPAKGVVTYQQFMQLGRDKQYHGPVKQRPNDPALQTLAAGQKNKAKTQPSVEPAKMQPIHVALSPTLVSANQTGNAVTQRGSDQRLEVQVVPGAVDITQARLAGGATPAAASSGGLTLQVTQKSGHYAGQSSILGTYDLQVVDTQGHAVQGVKAHKAVSFVYHYQPAELKALGIDPSRVVMSWSGLLSAAHKAKKPTTGLAIPMTNDAKNHTLTAQSMVLGPGVFALSSLPTVQQPPKPHLASVDGNSGNLSYTYPLQVPPGPDGFNPQLAFNYSSAAPNQRHSVLSPADYLGDGWSLGMGSISAETYSSDSAGGANTWYSLSGPNGISDRLVPDPNNVGSYYTEHLSYEKIVGQDMGSTTDTPSCFHVWDTSGTYYEYGCTSDSLQYITDESGTQHTYRWDLNLIVAPREGPNAPSKQITISYFQNMSNDATGYDTVRDAVMAQVVDETVNGSTTTVVSTVDFKYRAPAVPSAPAGASSSWVTPYGPNYNCTSATTSKTVSPPGDTSLRCDDPIDMNSDTKAPAVMSVFSLQQITDYVGTDTANHPAYSYAFNYQDTPFTQITDPISQLDEYAAGEHLLANITPTQYLGGTAYPLKEIAFSYTLPSETPNTYYDGEQTAGDGTTQYQVQTNWQYLKYYVDQNTNIGENISYKQAYSNTHGTPYVTDVHGVVTDDRHDPFYCTNQANNSDTSKRCSGDYAHPDDQTWSVQVVTVRSAVGKDSGDPNLQAATYNYTYTLGAYGNYASDYSSSGTFCSPATGNSVPAGQDDCTFDTYIPGPPGGSQDQSWQDFYHGEFRGFKKVYATSPDGNLTARTFYTPEAWGTPESDSQNYQSGAQIKEDKYWGDAEVDGQLISETVNQYTGTTDFLPQGDAAYSTACTSGVDDVYTPCEPIMVFTKTTMYEQNGTATANAPWVQTTYTYDDYSTSGGLQSGYHNLTQQQTSSSNAPTVTKKMTYTTNDSSDGDYVYYTVNKATHSEVDDASGHVWQCQDISYDEGSGATTPAAGWATTTKTYSDCNHAHTASNTFTTYTGFDAYGNTVGTVDAFGAANSSIYAGNGCTLATAPAVKSSSWTGRYTTCIVFDAYAAQATSEQNVLTQQTAEGFDDNRGRLPINATDVTGQTTAVSYSIDGQRNQTLQVKKPGETGMYSTQSSTVSSCTFGSNRPCYEIDDASSLYPGAVSRTFYDAQGRATETRTPQDATHDTLTFTVYNDLNDAKFASEPFRYPHGSGWVDPNGATIDNATGGTAPTGTITITDPLGRVVATRDPIEGTSAEPGITCASGNVTGTWTSCTAYGLGSQSGGSSLYDYALTHDANNHMSATFTDGLKRQRFQQWYSTAGSLNANITTEQESQYNALDKVTAVIMTDKAPQVGQSIISVSSTANYDDLGREISVSDPDRGTHTYSYDADSRLITDVSGTRTIGTSYDLLGRVRCIQDTAPPTNGSGNCNGHALVQNTYGTSYLQLSGTTDYATGRLTQSVATTYYADGTASTSTQQFEHDQRGRVIAANLKIGVPSAWNLTTALPTYQEAQSYNDADQPTMTQTTVGGAPGYTFSQAYDSTTGTATGLSNNATGVANLVTLSYDQHAQLSDINFLTSSATPVALANNHFTYDGALRPAASSATWQSGSGSTGTIFSTSRVYDPVGNVISTSTTQAAVPGQTGSGGSETQNFCYDEQGQLLWAGNGGTAPAAGTGTCGTATLSSGLNGAAYSSSYAYTHLGQLWKGPVNGSGAAQQYLYCDSTHPHRLSGIYPGGTTCSNPSGASYGVSYDSWGNVTSRIYNGTTATLSYDVLDHLSQWNAGSTSQEWYGYDATGGKDTFETGKVAPERTLRRSTTGSGTSLTVYAFGLEEHVYTSSGTNTSNTYYYSLANHLIGQSNGTATQYYLTDALGSVLSTFNATAGVAAVLGNQVYGPYGNQRYSKGSMGTSKGFTGQYQDPTGLDYYNARYYDPIGERFLSADTVQGNLQGFDPYAYVRGNPETLNDPTGHCAGWWDVGCNVQAAASDPWGTLKNIGQGMWNVADFFLNFSSIVHDFQTLLDGKKSFWDKLLAFGDLSFNLVSDVTMFMGAGEMLNGAKALVSGLKGIFTSGGKDLIGMLGKDGLKNLAKVCGGGLSFAFATKVTTASGSQAIGQLHVGEKVLAYNPKTQTMELEPILHIWINHDDDLVDLTISTPPSAKKATSDPQTSEVIHTTKKHPFLTQEQGFVSVADLHVGMHLRKADDSYGEITGWHVVSGSSTMYNLEVQQDHTFTVGDGQWVVHNSLCGDASEASQKAIDALKPNNLHHIFDDRPEHLWNLTGQDMKGNLELIRQTIEHNYAAISEATTRGEYSKIFDGFMVTVRGIPVNDIFRIGTAFVNSI